MVTPANCCSLLHSPLSRDLSSWRMRREEPSPPDKLSYLLNFLCATTNCPLTNAIGWASRMCHSHKSQRLQKSVTNASLPWVQSKAIELTCLTWIAQDATWCMAWDTFKGNQTDPYEYWNATQVPTLLNWNLGNLNTGVCGGTLDDSKIDLNEGRKCWCVQSLTVGWPLVLE